MCGLAGIFFLIVNEDHAIGLYVASAFFLTISVLEVVTAYYSYLSLKIRINPQIQDTYPSAKDIFLSIGYRVQIEEEVIRAVRYQFGQFVEISRWRAGAIKGSLVVTAFFVFILQSENIRYLILVLLIISLVSVLFIIFFSIQQMITSKNPGFNQSEHEKIHDEVIIRKISGGFILEAPFLIPGNSQFLTMKICFNQAVWKSLRVYSIAELNKVTKPVFNGMERISLFFVRHFVRSYFLAFLFGRDDYEYLEDSEHRIDFTQLRQTRTGILSMSLFDSGSREELESLWSKIEHWI